MRLLEAAAGERYDHAIQRALEEDGHPTSIREVRLALKDGRIRVDGRKKAPGERAVGGEAIELDRFTPRAEAKVAPEPDLLALSKVLFEDSALLALSKPSGVPTGPLRPDERGTLLGAAIARAPEIAAAGPPLEGGLVHRLDIETSGVVVFAKDPRTRALLRASLSAHKVEKRYHALVHDSRGALEDGQVIAGAIAQAGKPDRVRVVIAGEADALEAETTVRVLERFTHLGGLAWIEARTHTGRRHQIRAHLAAAGAPIAGDPIYGTHDPTPDTLSRLALHAASFRLPDGRTFEAPLAGDLESVLAALRSQSS